jgi:hypothetical protein
MPRRDYEDDDRPRRPRRDPDEDDRPRPRSRRYDEEDDYDDDPRPRRRRQSNPAPIILAGLGVAFLLLVGVVFGAVFLFRSSPRQNPQAPPPQWAGMPPPQMAPMGPMMGPQGVPGMPGVPGGPPAGAPAPAVQGTEAAISNIRRGGFGAKQSLDFDYRFNNGRPFPGGITYVAVVTEPGQQPEVVEFHGFIEQSGTMSVEAFAFGGRNAFPSGTTVYMGKRQFGPRGGIPAAISNTLTLP